MTSKFKVLTENTPPSSLEGNTEVLAQPSKLSQSSDNTPASMESTKQPSDNMLSTVKTDLQINDKNRQHAVLMKAALLRLKEAGLVKLTKVLSKDGTVLQMRATFDPSIWTTTLDLRQE